LVPLFEEHEALIYANYNYREWKKLPWWEKAMHVAQYRCHRLVNLHSEDAVGDRMESDRRRAEMKGK